MALLADRQTAGRGRRAVLARAAIGLVLLIATALLWLLILTFLVEAARRSVSPVGVVSLAMALAL